VLLVLYGFRWKGKKRGAFAVTCMDICAPLIRALEAEGITMIDEIVE
jgi:hypothetical protein